jgi:uncharacterized membrane protein YfcA
MVENIELFEIVLIFLFSAFVHGSIGFGFPMVATPMLAIFMDIQSAIILTIIPTILMNLLSIRSEGEFLLAVKKFFSLAFFAMIGSAVGTQILIYTDSELFKGLLGLTIIAYLFAGQINLRAPWIKEKPDVAKILFGFFAGVLGGLTNVMAPVLIIFSLESGYSKGNTVQALNSCFLLGKIVQLLIFSLNGEVRSEQVSLGLIMLVLVAITLFLSLQIRKRMKGDFYQKVLKIFLLILAFLLINSFMQSLYDKLL